MKKIIILLPVLSFSLLLLGHEFWLHPDKYIYRPGETINLRFQSGNNYDGRNWNGNQDSVERLQIFFDNVNDICTKNISGKKGDSLQLAVIDEGTAMLAFHSTTFFIKQDAEDFNNYLQQNGIQNAIEYRTKNNELNKPGKEFYQRCAKTIIQVGSKRTNAYKKATGLKLDIIPKENPYAMAKDGDFKVMVLYKNKPLTNATVKIWHRLGEKISTRNLKTDEEGEVKFFMATSGEWMVSCTQTELSTNEAKADWQSLCGTLTWGYTK
ncbi:MAG TPA: DUF4198 domain-containing protein [Chitinophagaceae bacterium]|jgi:ABC-type Co2+ transport system, periplasmic component